MEKIAVIGGGISGLTVANILKNRYDVTVFEKETTPGGLIRCERINGSLFHTCGGHVFNSKRKDVLDWFWSFFDRDVEFSKAERNSVVFMGVKKIPYPIENHVYLFDKEIQKNVIDDLLELARNNSQAPTNFEEFLKYRFGKTLYELYFKPYNKKVWRRELSNVPLTWLEGKLPMPTVQEIIFNNFIFQIIHSYFAHTTKYKNHIIQKYMKSYFIFTIVLTVAYLVYYAVIIVQDLYGKKGNGKPEEEVFDLGAPEDEQSVYVTESDTGFNVGNEKYETDIAPTASPAPQETETADNNGEIAVAEKLKRLKAQAEEQMEETETYLSDAYTADELYKAMLAKGKTGNRPKLVWKPLKDRL